MLNFALNQEYYTKGESMELGCVILTPGIEVHLKQNVTTEMWLAKCLLRHMKGDWGVIDEADRRVNAAAMLRGARVLSRYPLGPLVEHQFLYIITDGSREQTKILLPDEY